MVRLMFYTSELKQPIKLFRSLMKNLLESHKFFKLFVLEEVGIVFAMIWHRVKQIYMLKCIGIH